VLTDSLRRARGNAGLSLREVSKLAGIAASNLSTIENGRRDPTSATVERIAVAVGVEFLAVPLRGRVTAAGALAAIVAAEDAADPAGAYRTYLQLAADLAGATAFERVLMTAEEPQPTTSRWRDAVAGLVEWRLQQVAGPVAPWALQSSGADAAAWQPQRTPFVLTVEIDEGLVPEPLRRRGILVEEGELESA